MNACRTMLSIDRWFVALFAAGILLGSRPANGQNGTLGIAYPANEITVDGDVRDWPNGLQKYPIERIEFGDKLAGKDDLKAHFRIAYNPGKRAIYVVVVVEDDSIVLDGPGEAVWNAQDSCELFIDAVHAGSGSPIVQYARYGNQNRVVGPAGASEKPVKVAVARTQSQIIYEWCIEVAGEVDPDRAITFDVSVADKDKDGSFSWAAWGSGTQKIDSSDRCGEVLLVHPETRFGEVSGQVAWQQPSQAAFPPRVQIQSSRTAALWRQGVVDSTGTYKVTTLPAGRYTIHAVDSTDVRVEQKPTVEVEVVADTPTAASLLRVVPVPWPGMIGSEGVLRSREAFKADEFERFVRAYLSTGNDGILSIDVGRASLWRIL